MQILEETCTQHLCHGSFSGMNFHASIVRIKDGSHVNLAIVSGVEYRASNNMRH